MYIIHVHVHVHVVDNYKLDSKELELKFILAEKFISAYQREELKKLFGLINLHRNTKIHGLLSCKLIHLL